MIVQQRSASAGYNTRTGLSRAASQFCCGIGRTPRRKPGPSGEGHAARFAGSGDRRFAGVSSQQQHCTRSGTADAAAKHIEPDFLNISNDNITVGKYLISPLPKQLDNGWWAISVSIRCGVGSGTHDRVLRLTRMFQDKLSAAEYAVAEGLQWIRQRHTSKISIPV